MRYNSFMICLLIIYYLQFSCSSRNTNENNFTNDTFKQEFIFPIGEIYKNDSLFLGNPIGIKFHPDSFLIISDDVNKLIKIIDLKSHKIQEVISKGVGPGELLSALEFEIYGSDLFVLCPILGKIIKLSPDCNRNFEIADEFKIEEKGTFRFHPVKENLFVCLSKVGDEKRLTFFNEDGRNVRKMGDYPSLLNKDMKGDNNIFQSHITTSLDGRKILLACSTTDILEIYDTERGLQKRIQGPIGIQLVATNQNIGIGVGTHLEPSYATYCFANGSQDEFWVGYVGYKYEKGILASLSDTAPKWMFCFDWKGNPIRKIVFNNVLYGFDIDWINKILYTIEWINNKPEINYYYLDELIK